MSNDVKTFGDLLKSLRRQAKLSLRDLARKAADDPANISRIERRLRPAPGEDVTERFAKALGLVPQSEEWVQFMDMAALSRRELPRDITEEELALELPVFLKTLRGNRLPEKELLELKDTLFGELKPQ
ncbi:MAG TPA: helix-turn-helix transcriptional regulator [Verrucomicrobiota bacterium]|jgi:transcriptional regulator with XRE-family HTH domain|nr:helix-turn-helix transcriptional regulator [Verrucomicrobiota bacterium]